MKKIFLFLCALLVSFVTFCSSCGWVCSASTFSSQNSIKLLRITNDESIALSYLFPVNSQCFENVDAISFEGYKYYLKSTVSILSDRYRENGEGVEGVTVTEPKYYTDYDAVGFIIKFDNAEAYQNYFNIEDDDSSVEPKTSGLFIKKTSYDIAFPFSVTTADSLITLLKNTVIMWGETFNKDISTIVSIYDHTTFVYQIVSPSKSLRSENLTESGGVYYNTFERTYAELEESTPITLYSLQINRAMWYLFALVGVVAMVIIVFLWHRLSTKRKNQNKNV